MKTLRDTFAATTTLAMASLLTAGLWAQADTAEVKAPKADKLKKALSTMARLPSLAFETSTTTYAQSPFMRASGGRVPKPKPVVTETNGVASGDILSASVNDDEDQLVFHGRRMIAKNDDSDWALRRGKLANGSALPWVFDPELFFSTISQLPLKVMHKEVGTANNKPVETYTISFSGKAARNLLWGGVIPEPAGGGRGAMQIVMIAGGGGALRRAAPKVNMTVDLAISIDPATSLVHEVKVRTYSTANNAAFGGMIIRGRGFGGEEEDDEDEEDEEEEEDFDPEEPKFKGALPVRKKKGKTFMKFDISITQHNNAVLPDLNARARSLLHLPR